jgi:hypothetical protein
MRYVQGQPVIVNRSGVEVQGTVEADHFTHERVGVRLDHSNGRQIVRVPWDDVRSARCDKRPQTCDTRWETDPDCEYHT